MRRLRDTVSLARINDVLYGNVVVEQSFVYFAIVIDVDRANLQKRGSPHVFELSSRGVPVIVLGNIPRIAAKIRCQNLRRAI